METREYLGMWNEAALWLAFPLCSIPPPSSFCSPCTAALVENWKYIFLEKRFPEWDEKPSPFSLSPVLHSSSSALSPSNTHSHGCMHTGTHAGTHSSPCSSCPFKSRVDIYVESSWHNRGTPILSVGIPYERSHKDKPLSNSDWNWEKAVLLYIIESLSTLKWYLSSLHIQEIYCTNAIKLELN